MEPLVNIDFQLGNEHLTFQPIPWDSKFLHNTTVQILSTKPELPSPELLTKFCAQFSVGDLLFVKLAPTEQEKIQWFVDAGFYVIEHSVEPHLDLKHWNWTEPLSQNFHLRALRESEVKALSQLSAQAFAEISRYFLDPGISKQHAADRYADWIQTSFQNKEDIQVLTNQQDQVIGFFVNTYAGPVADNRLIALDPKWRGQGLGKELYVRMVQHARAAGATELISQVSANNHIAMKFYREFGAEFQHPQVVLHRAL